MLEHSVSVLHACVKYPFSMRYLQEVSFGTVLRRYMEPNIKPNEIRRRAWNAIAYVHHFDRPQSMTVLQGFKLDCSIPDELEFIYKLHSTSRSDSVHIKIGSLLVTIGAPQAMAARLKELVDQSELLDKWSNTRPLNNSLWNFTDSNDDFAGALKDTDLFRVIQDILRDGQLKEKLYKCEVGT